jgi:hypothetical protein
MDIFDEVHQVVSAIPQTPREFLIAAFDDELWQYATICRYRLRADGDSCYTAALHALCPDCGNWHMSVVFFAPRESGGFRLLKPEQVEAPL